ncbi:MAG: conjugal transfer protein TraG N-terminal domain-containing protein [Candidatus Nitrospinota bacterium M3_3B_026]
MRIFWVTLITIITSAHPALAWEDEFHVYNGFEAAYGAFRNVALIFSDVRYQGLFVSVVVLGMLFGMIGALLRAGVGLRVGVLSAWALPLLVGVMLYLAFVVPKGTIHVYDPVKNRYEAVSGVPDGMIIILGLLNKIERGLVDIISTAGILPPEAGYDRQAGGVGFDMLLGIGRRGVTFDDLHIHQSLKKYVDDCLFFGVNNPQPALNISPNDVAANTDFLSILGQADYNPIYTVYYDDSNPGGIELTCNHAWARLRSDLTASSNYDSITKAQCASAGFDPTIPAQLTQCKATLADAVNWMENTTGAYTAETVFRQAAIAQAIDTTVRKYSPDAAIRALADRNAGVSMISAGVAANDWVPVIRAVTLAIAVGLTPFLILFLPTPLFPRVAGMLVGFFVWITAWGVTDAIVHQFAMSYGYNTFEEVRQNQLGLHAIMMFETASMRTLAAFGAIRWTGAMLATVMTMMIIRFGGHAMAMFAGQLTAIPKSAGSMAGQTAATPEGASRALLSASESAAYIRFAERYNWTNRAGMSYFGPTQKMETAGQTVEALSGAGLDDMGAIESAADRTSDATAKGAMEKVGAAEQMKSEEAYKSGSLTGAGKRTRAHVLTTQDAESMAMAESARGVTGAQLLSIVGGGRSWGEIKDAARSMGFSNVSRVDQATFGDVSLEGRAVSAFNQEGVEVARAFTGYATKEQLGGIADWAHGEGHHRFASYMSELAGWLGAGERVQLSLAGDADGWATAKAEHGASVLHYDLAQKRWLEQRLEGHERVWQDIDKHVTDQTTTVQEGYKVQRFAVDEYLASWGAKYDSQTAIQAALNRDPRLYDAVTDPGLTGQQRDTLMWALSAQIVTGMVSRLEGIDADKASASLGVGGDAWIASAGASTSAETLSRESVDSRIVDIHDRIISSYKESYSQKLNRMETGQAMADATGMYIEEVYKRAETDKYGPKEIIKDMLPDGLPRVDQNDKTSLDNLTNGMD